MKFLQKIMSRWIKNEKHVLGRWNIEHCDMKMSKKVDLSNEDHCGPCGQYILYKANMNANVNANVNTNMKDAN